MSVAMPGIGLTPASWNVPFLPHPALGGPSAAPNGPVVRTTRPGNATHAHPGSRF
jgi:hypothetical protein